MIVALLLAQAAAAESQASYSLTKPASFGDSADRAQQPAYTYAKTPSADSTGTAEKPAQKPQQPSSGLAGGVSKDEKIHSQKPAASSQDGKTQRHPSSQIYCALQPSSISIPTSTQAEISISCFSLQEEVPCPQILWSATVGTISGGSSSATYTASSMPASGTITASGVGNDNILFNCFASVNVFQEWEPAYPNACFISPSSLSIGAGQQQLFSVSCHNGAIELACPQMGWSSTIGSVLSNNTTALFSAGSSAGSGAISAFALSGPSDFSCLAQISVSAPAVPSGCKITPRAIAVGTNQQATFFVSCFNEEQDELACPQMSWSSTIGTLSVSDDTHSADFISSTAGSGKVTATSSTKSSSPGKFSDSFSCEADVSVSSTPLIAERCELSPASLSIGINQEHTFRVSCFSSQQDEEIPCPQMGWSATIGSISPSSSQTAVFSSPSSPGRGEVAAFPKQSPALPFRCSSEVTVVAATGGIAQMRLFPPSAALYTGQTQQFVAKAYDANGNFIRDLAASEVNWSVNNTVGRIDADGLFTAVGVGTTTVRADYRANTPGLPIFATAIVSVSSLPPSTGGGGGALIGTGSNNGGGSFRTSTKVGFTCEGQPASVAITYYDSAAPEATVAIYHLGQERTSLAFSQKVSTTTALSFTPQKAGNYEIRVSLGTDQTTTSFYVPPCTPQTANVTQSVTVRLAPQRELVLSKTVRYAGGFSKLFEVYKISRDATATDYESQITMTYTNSGNALQEALIMDSVPSGVVASASQIFFETQPSSITYGQAPRFEWNVKAIPAGGKAQFKYSISRMLTEAMIEKFEAPRLITTEERLALAQASQEQSKDLLTASISFAGISLSAWLVLVLLLGLILAFLIYAFVFSRKRKSE
ncbi:MAG: Ig-like domain-containing protein [Candidatus Micrarchaeota archaeon]|nr:Ig-like domain-containing protein [Candidatus Micrarchaeota archaeon]